MRRNAPESVNPLRTAVFHSGMTCCLDDNFIRVSGFLPHCGYAYGLKLVVLLHWLVVSEGGQNMAENCDKLIINWPGKGGKNRVFSAVFAFNRLLSPFPSLDWGW